MSRSACLTSALPDPGRPHTVRTPLVDRVADAYARGARGPRLDPHVAGTIAALKAMFAMTRDEIEELGREVNVASDQYDALEAYSNRKRAEAKQ